MKPIDRQDWIESHMRAGRRNEAWDVCNSDFVDAYIEATGASFRPTNYGAYKCPQLGRDLGAMVKGGVLKRNRMGIEGMAGLGFPKWVWGYRLAFWIEADEKVKDKTGKFDDLVHWDGVSLIGSQTLCGATDIIGAHFETVRSSVNCRACLAVVKHVTEN